MHDLRPPIFLIVFIVAYTIMGVFFTPSIALSQGKDIVMFIPNTDWPPYLIDTPNPLERGVLIEVLQEICHPLGYSVTTRRLPNKRGWIFLDSGEVDVHAKAKEWVKNPDDYLWTEPFMINEDVMMYSANSTRSYSSPESMYGTTVAAISGFVYPALEQHFGKGKICRVDVSSPFAMLELLSLGRVDAALVNRTETQWLLRNRPDLHPERFRMDDTPFDSAAYRYVFTKKKEWASFLDAFNKELNAMKQDGRLRAIMNKYQ